MRKAHFIESRKAVDAEGDTPARKQPINSLMGKPCHPNSLKNLEGHKAPPFQPGVSGNPGGLPGTDLAQKYAREFFEKHRDGITKEMAAALRGFNGYGFSVLADRAFGKLVEKQQIATVGVSLEDVLRARKKIEESKEEMARRLGRSKDTPPDDPVPDNNPADV
jgi:hypothetical protein